MQYTDNPRKLHGKLEIIYSDTEISRDIQTKVSKNAEISHPIEVYGDHLTPSVKGCTMDGNSTMDGTFQMMTDSVIIGWWSGNLADGNGVFKEPTWLEISFVMRPIISWQVFGDEKRNEYPVDFTMEYKRDGAVIKTETITNNRELRVKLLPQLADITSIRITITKWSKPNACAKIFKFYDRMVEVYEGDELQMFELTEAMCSSEGNYNISSDSLTATIYNKERKFDKGYLRTLMVLDRKLKPSIGIERNGSIEYTDLGIFYSDGWQLTQDSQWVKCTSVDRLMRLQKRVYVGFPLTMDASLYDIAKDILDKTSELKEPYRISNDLKDVIIPMAYLPKMSAWDALQEIANAGLCKVFIDRDDCLYVRSEEEVARKSASAIGPSNMFSYASTISLTDFANRVSVEYCEVTLSEDVIQGCEVEITLDPNATISLTLDYTTEIAYPSIETDNFNVQLKGFNGGINACSVTAINKTAEPQTAVLTVIGNAIEISTKTVTVQDEESVRNNGITEYTHPASDLVQSLEQADYMARLLLSKMRAGEGVITTEWRGNPELDLGDKYESTDRFGDKLNLVCEANKFTFDGGLRQETRGRKI